MLNSWLFIIILMVDDDEDDCLFMLDVFMEGCVLNNLYCVEDGVELFVYLCWEG